MAIYEYEKGNRTWYVRASEDDGVFTSEDWAPGRGRGLVAAFAGSLEELVAKGIRDYPTPFAAGALEYRVTAPNMAQCELTRDEALNLMHERLSGMRTGASGTIDRRKSGERWFPWRRYVVKPDGGVARTDR